MFDEATLRAIDSHARDLKCEPAALQAVVSIESAGKVYARVRGRDEPYIRFEGHYFDRRLTNGKRAEARRLGLASPKAGAVKNPSSQEKRWDIVHRAAGIDRQAALESFSIGLGQVMTAHWRKLDFLKVDDLIELARRDAAGQVDLMVRYIKTFGLADELQRLDFTGFARGYNGPGYAKGGYHTRMAAEYKRLSGKGPVSKAAGMLRMGSKGARVRELQGLLVRAGYAVNIDGDFGPATRDAIKAFQKDQRITVDGVAGPETIRRIEAWKVEAREQVGQQKPSEVKEVRDATKGGGLLVLVVAIRDQIAETAAALTGIEAETAQSIANWLMAGSGAIGIGLAAWGLYGWWKSRQTDEGDVEPAEVDMPAAADPVLA